MQQSLCSEMLEELRFAIWCFGKSTKNLKKNSSISKRASADDVCDGPNGTMTPLKSTYHENALNHRITYSFPHHHQTADEREYT